jgi:type IV secretion system protein VirB10
MRRADRSRSLLARLLLVSEAVAIDDSLPLVGEDRGNRGLWLGLGAIVVSGLLLFTALEASRQSHAEPQSASPKDYATATAPHAELMIPENYSIYGAQGSGAVLPVTVPAMAASQLPPVRLTRIAPPVAPAPSTASQQPPSQVYSPPAALTPFVPDPGRAAPAVVYDAAQGATAATQSNGTTAQATKAVAVGGGDRTYLVSQGTLIFAVLETAIDSTQSGQVRAMISNNVYNPLGTQILIPKGSRIFGEYKGELGAGQSRAQIIWTRLIRPDGATISLDSPASDQLGRAGVKGRVNTHFGERLLGALLQSTIDFGVLAASRAVSSNNGVIVALPSATQGAASQIVPPAPKPTLKVRHGTRIAVLVARDLDFSSVE